MKVIKRDGSERSFNAQKIRAAIEKANKNHNELSDEEVIKVVNDVLKEIRKYTRAIDVDEIQDIVENSLMKSKAYNTAKSFIKFRYKKAMDRRQNTTDSQILTTVNLENEEVKQENSNKNPVIVSTQRDYIAGLVSKDLTNRYLLPNDISDAHNKGIIHFHDADYFVNKEYNCCLWNLEDMLQMVRLSMGLKLTSLVRS